MSANDNNSKKDNPIVGSNPHRQTNNAKFVHKKRRQSSSPNKTNLILENKPRDGQEQPLNVQLINPNSGIHTTTNIEPEKTREFQGVELVPIIKSTTTIVRQIVVNSYTYKLKLTFVKVTPEDYGEYMCISSNSLGNSTTNFVLQSKFQ